MVEFEKSYDSNDLIDKFGVYIDNHRIVEDLNKKHKYSQTYN